MKVLALCLLVALSGVSGGMVKRAAAGGNLFPSGKEHVFRYTSVVVAGSKDYVSFGAAFNVSGELHVVSNGNTLNVKLTNLKAGIRNGEYHTFGTEYVLQEMAELEPLAQPFQVQLESGHVKDVILSADIPEWARNMQRGIANTLQVDLTAVGDITAAHEAEIQEETIIGKCLTYYQIIPQDANHIQVRKFRSHEDCSDVALQVRRPNVHYHSCPDYATRDILNSSGATNYDVELKDGEWVPKRIGVHSTLAYRIFGAKGHEQYSYGTIHLELVNANAGGSVAAPSNGKAGGIRYVFENVNDPNEDLTVAKPFYFHDKEIAAGVQEAAQKQLEDAITAYIDTHRKSDVLNDLRKFHRNTPFAAVQHANVLDYEHLKKVYAKVSGESDVLQKKVFLDLLVTTGTGPAALLLRDIIKESENPIEIMRLFSNLVSYIRNPTEKLAQEYEALLRPVATDRKPKVNGRIIDLAFASLIGKVCKASNGCKSSGLLDKYVKLFSDRYDGASGFEEKTAAVGALRNIGIGGAVNKLKEIATDKKAEDSIRVQAIPGLAPLSRRDPKAFKNALLPIFYDRQEHAEVRSVAAKYILVYGWEHEVANQMVMYMWTERCKMVKNYMYTLLSSVANSKRPCLQNKASYAKSFLTFFPPHTVDPRYSANYLSDYYDEDYGFGQMTDYVVHKTGASVIPTAAYVNFNGAIAGFGNSYATLFVRMEGVGKALFHRIMTTKTQINNFDDIKAIFAKIGVIQRTNTPLKVELGVMLQGRVITYHALDSKFSSEVPKLIPKILSRLQQNYDVDLARTTNLGGAMTERPNELGIPVTTFSSALASWNLKAKADRRKEGDVMSSHARVRLAANLYGISAVSNHIQGLGVILSVSAHRTGRMRQPRDIQISFDITKKAADIVAQVPKEDDPAIAMFHATALTTVMPSTNARYGNNKVEALLGPSKSKPITTISKGDDWRQERQVGVLYKYLTGVKGGLKYFDCEKVHNRAYVAKQLRKIFGPENKNDGGRVISRIRLGLSYLRESLFFSPITETCGFKAYFHQDASQPTVFDHVEGHIEGNLERDYKKKIDIRVQAKAKLKMVYTGAQPKSRNFALAANFGTTGLYERRLRLRLGLDDEITNKKGVVCVITHTTNSKAIDWFNYDGQNEPTQERKITVFFNKEAKDENACPDEASSPTIKYVRKSHRSQWQKEEAKSDHWPYSKCNADKASGKYPGTLSPATEPCIWAAFEQTKLREANITIDYKVDPEARNRWKKPGAVLAALLLPYYVPEVEGHIDEHAHHHGSQSGDFIQGKIELDVDFSPKNSHVDIHFHGSQGNHEHYHDVDLDFLPLRFLSPVSTRFSPLQFAVFKHGIKAYCDVTTRAVQTFDNVTYHADISECNTLLSADCGPHPRYAVYGRKMGADQMAITVQIAGHKIELTDTSKVTVDGAEQALTNEVPYNVGDKKLVNVVRLDENNVIISSMWLGVDVRYTKHYTTIVAGSRYRATQCGVCGNFNGKCGDEFTGPDPNCKNLTPENMMKAYIIREGNCEGVGSDCPEASA